MQSLKKINAWAQMKVPQKRFCEVNNFASVALDALAKRMKCEL